MLNKIGILGGTFDPIHLGHLRAAVEIREGFGLDAVYLIPAAIPPHKCRTDIAAPEDRLEMVRRVVEDLPELRVSDIELKRQGPSYTIDTICAFREKLSPKVWVYLIMGIDAFLEINTWKSYEDLLHIVPSIVINRPEPEGRVQPSLDNAIETLMHSGKLEGYECSQSTPCYTHCAKQPIFTYNVTPMAISSTHIRQLVKKGRCIDFLVPPCVKDYIHAKGLYR
ncbi:MAG: nicotinate (nicotinamide) nucleotide adenylyltransferase [Desulfosarcina sp.]|nr:nicotinate (nicotinamide) nucleotide adenylyltransferase [Desulfobacterales bacterium]